MSKITLTGILITALGNCHVDAVIWSFIYDLPWNRHGSPAYGLTVRIANWVIQVEMPSDKLPVPLQAITDALRVILDAVLVCMGQTISVREMSSSRPQKKSGSESAGLRDDY